MKCYQTGKRLLPKSKHVPGLNLLDSTDSTDSAARAHCIISIQVFLQPIFRLLPPKVFHLSDQKNHCKHQQTAASQQTAQHRILTQKIKKLNWIRTPELWKLTRSLSTNRKRWMSTLSTSPAWSTSIAITTQHRSPPGNQSRCSFRVFLDDL